MLGGIRLICSEHALQEGNVRLFPTSKNRSARIHKKLVKRFGGEFKKVPAIWRMGDTFIAHPEMMHLIRQEIASANAGLGKGKRFDDRTGGEPPSRALLDRLPLGNHLIDSFLGAGLGNV